MTQTILADPPDRLAQVLCGAPHEINAQEGWLHRPGADQPEYERACLLVPCDRCGASQFQRCPGGQPCGARRLLAVERGHLDPDTGVWLTRGWRAGGGS